MKQKTKTESPPAEPLEIAPNQKAASAAWNVPLAVLKAAKADGCQAFKPGGRILRTAFFDWLKSNSTAAETAVALDIEKAERAELEKEKLRAQIVLLRSRNDRETGEVIPRALAAAEWMRAAAIFAEECRMFMSREHYALAVDRAQTRIGNMFAD